LHFTVANARRADTDTLAGAFNDGVDALQVQIPTAVRLVIRVAYSMAKLRPAAAQFTVLRHDTLLLSAPLSAKTIG
jgi:hypothetical protein